MKKKIKEKLHSILRIQYLKIINNSKLHNSYKNKLKHYTIIIVANEFNNISKIEQHKKIFSIFFNDIPEKIYSMKLYTYSINEWKKKKNKIFLLTPCLNQKINNNLNPKRSFKNSYKKKEIKI